MSAETSDPSRICLYAGHADEAIQEHVQRQVDEIARKDPVEYATHLLLVTLGQRAKDRILVREIPVERADRDAGPLGDAVCRRRLVTDLGKEIGGRIEDQVHTLLAANLLGRAPHRRFLHR